jgi:hypothetical protein
MTITDAEESIYAYIASVWEVTPLAWRNVDPRNYGDPSQPLLPDGEADYVSVGVDIFSATTLTVPGNCIRYTGQATFGVCVPERTGTRVAKTYVSQLCDLLENQRLRSSDGSLAISTLSNQVSYWTENGWYVVEAAFPIYFERYLDPQTVDIGS